MGLECSIVRVTAFMQYCSIFKCIETGKAAVVDPGGDLEKMIAELDNMGATIDQLPQHLAKGLIE